MADENTVRALLNAITSRTPADVIGAQALGAASALAAASTPKGVSAAAVEARPDAPVIQTLGEEATPGWTRSEGVAAFGLGEKVTCGRLEDEVVLRVYVEKKLPLRKVDNPVPKLVSLGGLAPVSTDVVEIGKVGLQGNTQRIRPAIPGFSVSRADDRPNTGTFGMVVRKKGQAAPYYLLSNCHAIAASGLAQKGDVIIQPGTADQGAPAKDRIGTLVEWVPFDFTPNSDKNCVDAAIAQLDEDAASAAIAILGVPSGVDTEPSRGMYVQKVGRTTTHSVARVTDVDLVLNLTYPTATGLQQARLRDQVLATFYSAPGDSGSGVLDMDNRVVGLHVGGSDIVGFFCKIGNVLDAMGLEVVTTASLSPATPTNDAAPALSTPAT